MSLTSFFPENHGQNENEYREQKAQFRSFAGRIREQLQNFPAIAEAVNAREGQKTAFSRAQDYFKQLAISQLGKKEYTINEFRGTDAGKICNALRIILSLSDSLETVTKTDVEDGTARMYWGTFRRDFNQLIETDRDYGKKSMADAFHDLLEGPLGFGSLNNSNAMLVSELCQLVQNIEQEAELLDFQTTINETQWQFERFKEDESRFSRDVESLIKTAIAKKVSLKDLDKQYEDALYDKKLSDDRLKFHQAQRAEMQKKWEAASAEYLSAELALNNLTAGLEDLKATRKAHLEGDYGANDFRKNYYAQEEADKREITHYDDRRADLRRMLAEDDEKAKKKEEAKAALKQQKADLDKMLSKNGYKKAYAEFKKKQDHQRRVLNVERRFDLLDKKGMNALLQKEKTAKKTLTAEDKFLLSEYRELKKELIEVLKVEYPSMAPLISNAFKDKEDPEKNPKNEDVVSHVRTICRSLMEGTIEARLTNELNAWIMEHRDIFDKVVEIESGKNMMESVVAETITLTPKERKRMEEEILETREARERKLSESKANCEKYCKAMGIPFKGEYITFYDMAPMVDKIVAEDAEKVDAIEKHPDIPKLKQTMHEQKYIVDANSDGAYRIEAEKIQKRIAQKKERVLEIGRIQTEFSRLCKNYRELGKQQAELLKTNLPGTVPNAAAMVKRLERFRVRSDDARERNHQDTQEFQNMIQAIDNAKVVMSKEKVTRQESIEAMRNLRIEAQKYLDAKHKQTRLVDSTMRKTRLRFAENLVKYGDASLNQLENEACRLRGADVIARFVENGQSISPDITKENFGLMLGMVQEGIEKPPKQEGNAREPQKNNVMEKIHVLGMGH